jgi:hypothetical protein
MINIIEYNLGVKRVVMRNLITDERAEEFLQIFNDSKSATNKRKYYIENTFGNTTTSDELEKKRRANKLCLVS